MTSVSSLTLTTDVKNPVGKLQGGFECKYCSFQTQDLNEFTSHVDSAHPHVILNPTYICKLCNFSTKRYEMFMQHNQKNHPDNTKLALKVIKQNGTTFLEQNPVGGTEENSTANGEKNTAEVETEADQDKNETQGEDGSGAVGAFRAPMMQKLLDQKSSASKGDTVSNDQFSASSTLQKLCQTAANPPVTYATISVSNTDSHKNAVLRQYFDKFPYFTDKELDEIIDKTGMTNNEVRTWFNAQRQKLSVSWTAEEIEQYRVSGVPATWAQQKKEPEKTMKVVKTLFPSTRVSPAAKERTKTPAKASRPKPSPAGEGRNWKKTPEQLQLLKRAFGKTQFPTPLEVDKLVRASGLTAGVVKKWFSDTRYHVKHSKGTKGLCVYREDLNETLDSIIESSSVKSPHKNPRGRPPNSPKARGRPPLSQSARGRPRSPRSPRAQLNFNTPDSSTPKVKIERSSMDMEWLERKGKSEYQLDLLKIHFQQNPYPSEFDIDKLREETKMTAREIGRWFNDCRREKGLPQDEKYYVPPQEAVTQGTEEEADDAITPKDEPLSPGQPDLVDYFNGDVVEEDSGSDNDKSRSNDVNENSVQRDNGNKGRVASSRKVADLPKENASDVKSKDKSDSIIEEKEKEQEPGGGKEEPKTKDGPSDDEDDDDDDDDDGVKDTEMEDEESGLYMDVQDEPVVGMEDQEDAEEDEERWDHEEDEHQRGTETHKTNSEEQNKKKSGDVKTTMKVFYDRTGRVKRRFKTEYQLRLLKESFQRCPHPDDLEIERLMRLTRLSKQDIRNYFSDKRYDVFKRNPHKMHQLSHQPHEPPSTLEDYLDEDDSLPTMVPPGTNMVLSPADILTRKRKRDDVEDFEEDGKIDGKKTAFQLDVVKASFSLNQRPGDTEVARINKLTKLSRKEILCWFGDTRYAFKHGKVKWIEKYRKMTEDPHYKKYLGMDQDDTSAPTSGETSPVTATSTPRSVPTSPVRHSAHASSVDSTPTQSHQTESPTQQESPEQERSPVSGKESIIGLQSIVSSMNPQKPLTNVEKLKMLTEQYERCPFILYHDAEELAAKTDLRVEQVLSWFERKREEEKKDTNEEDGHESEEEAASSMVHRSPNMAQRPLLDPDMQIQIIKPPMSQQQRPPAVTHIMNQQRPIAPRPILHPSLRPVVSPPMPRQHAPQQLRMQVPGNVQGQNFVMVSQVPQQHHMVQPGMLGPGGRPQIIYTIVPNQPAPSTPSQPQAIRVQSAMSLATGQQVMMQSSPPLQHQGVPSQPQPTMVVSSPPPPNVHQQQQQQHNNDRPNDLVRSILASCKIDISNWETVVYQCPRCKAVFPRWAPLENHEKVCNTPREDGTKPKPCIYLTMALVESYFMKEDVMTEDSSPLFKCSLCNQPYIEEKSLPLHLEEHTKQDVCMKYMYQLE